MDFTKNNPALAPLFTVTFPEEQIPLPNKKMPRSLQTEAKIMYEALFGETINPDDFTLILKSNERGELQRIYGPSVSKDPDSNALAIKWGEKYVVIKVDGTSPVGPKLSKGSKWDNFALDMANFGYKDDEMALKIMLENSEGFYGVNLPLRFQDPKTAPDLAGFKTLLKKDAETAYALLFEAFEGVGGGGGAKVNRLTDLGEGAVLTNISFEKYEFTSKKGEELVRILVTIPNEEDPEKPLKYWSHDDINHVYHLFTPGETTIELKKLGKGKKNEYIAAGVIYDNKTTMHFGSDTKALKEKTLPIGEYRVWGVDSFQGKKQSFTSYVYTIEPVYYREATVAVDQDDSDVVEKVEDTDIEKTLLKCFAPSKHRTVLASQPIIDNDHAGKFEIFVSGADDEDKFTVSKLDAFFPMDEDSINLDNLF